MKLHQRTRTRKGVNIFRISSAILVLGMLVLVVAETAKYLYSAKVPKSVSSRIEPSIQMLASVLGAAKSSIGSQEDSEQGNSVSTESPVRGEGIIQRDSSVLATIAVLSDSHNDLEYLGKALSRIKKDHNVDYIVFLGDYTDYGEVSNLKKSKELMDTSGIPYISIPGDHDIAETRDESNFSKVFGNTYGILPLSKVKAIYFNNSKNYTKIDVTQISWFEKEIKDSYVLFLSQPLLTESVSRVMGIIDGVKDVSVYEQNIQLLTDIRNSDVQLIIAGDLHQFTKYQDPVRSSLWHYTSGSLLSHSVSNPWQPRFSILTIYNDKTYQIQNMAID